MLDDLERQSSLAICAVSIVSGILQMYAYCQFQSISHTAAIQARFPRIVRTEALILVFVLCFVIPIALINKQWISEYQRGTKGIPSSYIKHQELLHHIMLAWIKPSMSYFMSHIEAMRLWLMYFELRLMESLQIEDWGSKITSNFSHRDFYLQHRSTIGNVDYIARRGIIYWIVITVLSGLSAWFLMTDTSTVSDQELIIMFLFKVFLFLSPLVFIAYLYWKSPKAIKNRHDNMMIDEEFRMTSYIVALSFVFYIISMMLLFICHETVTFLNLCLSWIFTLSAPSFVATLWIPRKLKKMKTLRMMEKLTLNDGLFKDRGLNPDGTETRSRMEEIKNLFLDKHKMRAMAQWMMRDWTFETFLAFVEMTQFKDSIIAVVNEQNEHFDEKAFNTRYACKFYKHCPKSSIVNFAALEKELMMEDNEIEIVVEMEQIEEEQDEKLDVEEEEEKEDEEEHQQKDEEQRPISPMKKVNLVSLLSCHQTVDNSASGCSTQTSGVKIEDNKQCQNSGDDDGEKALVLRAEDVHRFKHIAHLLFKKYVDTNAVWEINIGHELRNRAYRLEEENYAALKASDWIRLNDQILDELWQYITQSYARMISNLLQLEKEKNDDRR